jgi:hypothetical protein
MAGGGMTWQILIPHIPHRHDKLIELLDVLAAQMEPGVEVVIYTDNLDVSYTDKLNTLMDTATADYVSVLSNDDLVSPDFVPLCMTAMKSWPDYIGFKVRYTEAGVPQQPVIHSLQCGRWIDTPEILLRDLMYYNPIKRGLAQRVRFRGQFCDTEWADDLRALGCVRTEVFIDQELHYYQRDPADNFHTSRVPMEEMPVLPDYPFVRHLCLQS